VAAEDGEDGRAHDTAGSDAAIAVVVEGTVAQESLPSAAGVKELEKEDELALPG
jgi:hypothetical protein